MPLPLQILIILGILVGIFLIGFISFILINVFRVLKAKKLSDRKRNC